MEPRPISLSDLAESDPIAALGIALGIPRVPTEVSMSGSFSTLAVASGPPLKASFSQNAISQKTWIDNIQYDLQCPNVFPNQIFKPQFDAYLKQSPGISVQLEVLGGPKYLLSPDFTPLECVSNLIGASRWPAGWPLGKFQTVQGLFLLTQAPGGAPSTLGPYSFTVTFNGWQFEDCNFGERMDPDLARDKLREAGILRSKKVCWP